MDTNRTFICLPSPGPNLNAHVDVADISSLEERRSGGCSIYTKNGLEMYTTLSAAAVLELMRGTAAQGVSIPSVTIYPPEDTLPQMAANSQMNIHAMVFCRKGLVIEVDKEYRDHFWLQIHPDIGWLKFEEVDSHIKPSAKRKCFLASQLRSALDSTPHPVTSLRLVLYPRQEALESHQLISSYLQKISSEN